MFILNGIDKRKVVIDTIKKESEKLGIDYTVVISSLLGEQIRIACSGFRGSLKEILLNSTPTLLRSYNISLGIGGIKRTAAIKIQKDAKKYGYGQVFGSGVSGSGLEERLTDSDYRQ